MITIEDMFATKADAINSYQQDIKALNKIITQKNDEVLLLRKALREIKEKKVPCYWKSIDFFDKRDYIVDTIWDICEKALRETARYELQESCLESEVKKK